MDERPIYLDYNATTPVLDEVIDAMLPYLREHFGNPSSGHAYGQRARAAVDLARSRVASLVDCDPDEIVFTSGCTESNNLAIVGAAEAALRDPGSASRRGVVTTTIEHPATDKTCASLESRGFSLVRVGVDSDGRARLDLAADAIDEGCALVTVMHANNETGVLQPIHELARLARARGAIFHCDAAQSVGKIPVSVRALGVDLLSIAGHKLYAPKGVGALFVRREIRGSRVAPIAYGASHEQGLRPGTENVPYVVALGAACAVALRDLASESARVGALRDELWSLLRASCPGAVINGHPSLRLPNTLSVRFSGVSATALLAACPEIAASTGSACHDGHEQPSGVLLAMGLEPGAALGTVRLTLGRGTRDQDVRAAAEAIARAYRLLAQRG
jgi:cysteine desulfurase